MDNAELIKRYELATSKEYLEVKRLVLDYLIGLSTSSVNSERIQGALMVLRYVDSWVSDYETALALRKEEI